jgi:hypothetical protein
MDILACLKRRRLVKKSRFVTYLLLTAFVCSIVSLIMFMVVAGSIYRKASSQTGEPKNAYLIHIVESGEYREYLYCQANKCLTVTFPGVTGIVFDTLHVEGVDYTKVEESGEYNFPTGAQGFYCIGPIDTYSCLVVTFSGNSCSDSITYMGLKAPLVPDTCLEEK